MLPGSISDSVGLGQPHGFDAGSRRLSKPMQGLGVYCVAIQCNPCNVQIWCAKSTKDRRYLQSTQFSAALRYVFSTCEQLACSKMVRTVPGHRLELYLSKTSKLRKPVLFCPFTLDSPLQWPSNVPGRTTWKHTSSACVGVILASSSVGGHPFISRKSCLTTPIYITLCSQVFQHINVPMVNRYRHRTFEPSNLEHGSRSQRRTGFLCRCDRVQ